MLSNKESSPFDVPYLPDDILLNCLVRVSRLYHPTLSLVSKRFCSLIASPELYKARTLLGRKESCLYVCLGFHSDSLEYESNPHWFTLCRRPTRILNPNPSPSPSPNPNSRWFPSCLRPYTIVTNPIRKEEKKSRDNLLVSVPTPTRNFWRTQTAVGSNIYMIGEYYKLSSRVFFMDCKSHTWHEAPSMWIARRYPIVSVLDGIIYVVEGFKDFDSKNLIESFDPKTQIWELVPSPSAGIRMRFLHQSLSIDGKLYLFGTDCKMVYTPTENKWDVVDLLEMRLLTSRCINSCVIGNVLYWCGLFGKLQWYDFERRSWRGLRGLKDLPRLPGHSTSVKLVDYMVESLRFCGRRKWALFSLRRRIRRRRFGVLRFPLKGATDTFMGRLSGVMLCLQSPSHVLYRNFLLLLFKE